MYNLLLFWQFPAISDRDWDRHMYLIIHFDIKRQIFAHNTKFNWACCNQQQQYMENLQI